MPNRDSSAPLTDAWLDEIAERLAGWFGAKAAAAAYAGISRQNLGKFFRERGVGRDSEVLLKLDDFSRLPVSRQMEIAGKRRAPAGQEFAAPAGEPAAEENQLPAWLL